MFLIDVVDVRPLEGHKLELTFKDGLKATVDLDRVIRSFEGVFAPLRDPEYFRLVRVDPEIGTIVWPNGADLCPDVLYSYASGKPIIVNGERVLNRMKVQFTRDAASPVGRAARSTSTRDARGKVRSGD